MRPPEPWAPIVGSAAAFSLVPGLVIEQVWWALPLVLLVLLAIYAQDRALWEAAEREAYLLAGEDP